MKGWYNNTLDQMVIENNLTMVKIYKTINSYILKPCKVTPNILKIKILAVPFAVDKC